MTNLLDSATYIELDKDGKWVVVAGKCLARDLQPPTITIDGKTRVIPMGEPVLCNGMGESPGREGRDSVHEPCGNCEDPTNVATGYVELWDGVCPDCGRLVEKRLQDAWGSHPQPTPKDYDGKDKDYYWGVPR